MTDITQLIKAKHCQVCEGDGNFCTDIKGKSVCGLCQIEGVFE